MRSALRFQPVPPAVLFGLACLSFPGTVLSGRLAVAEETPAPAKKILRLTLKGEIFESHPPFEFFGSALGVSLREVVAAIRKAASDDQVAGLELRLKDATIGWAQLQTLRRELLRFRQSGKPSHCHLELAESGAYVLASAAGEVSLAPAGIIELSGVTWSRLYFKGLLDKLGVRCEELRMGRYKSAAESLTREGPSDPVREEMHSLLDEFYADYVDSIAENRSLKPVVVRGLVDQALFSAQEAREAGLVDRVEYEDEFRARLNAGGLEIANARLGRQLEVDFSGFGGLMKLLNELLGSGAGRRSTKEPKLALVYGLGPILSGRGGESLFGGEIMGSDEMVSLFRRVREDDTVRAVVFRIDSPGGSALASDQIWRAVRITAEKKPVVVSMGDVAASGGYYIACPATWIFAERSTLTGSIGVIGVVPALRGLYEKLGLAVYAIGRGKRALMVSPYGELTDDGREVLLRYMRRVYDDFTGHVAEGRKLPVEAVRAVAEGRVWTGSQAREHGLVDALGGLDAALAKAGELGGLPPEAEVLVLPRPKELIDFLRGGRDEDVLGGALLRAALRSGVQALPAAARRSLRQLEWIQALGEESLFCVLPEVLHPGW